MQVRTSLTPSHPLIPPLLYPPFFPTLFEMDLPLISVSFPEFPLRGSLDINSFHGLA